MTDSVPGATQAGDVLAALARIEGKLERIEAAVERAEALAAASHEMAATVTDTIDGIIDRLGQHGIDVDARGHIVAKVAERLTSPAALAVVSEFLDNVDKIQHLLDSGIFSHGAVDMVGRAACAIGKLDPARTTPVGPFGALRAMRDPDSKRALGVLVEFARAFGSGQKGTCS
ncbi:MAG: DUF1641 domain-containing protein [Planctomycetes bacterium]|nr:DUF1641 domain-containing protein [Planctomycetota bacterium]MCB9920429.1 DUF1641 domain-containing protein [Planctomycetota bacterium]